MNYVIYYLIPSLQSRLPIVSAIIDYRSAYITLSASSGFHILSECETFAYQGLELKLDRSRIFLFPPLPDIDIPLMNSEVAPFIVFGYGSLIFKASTPSSLSAYSPNSHRILASSRLLTLSHKVKSSR